jgi:hypothetical protein
LHRTNAGVSALAEKPIEHADGVVSVDPPATPDRWRLAGGLVDDVEQLQDRPSV